MLALTRTLGIVIGSLSAALPSAAMRATMLTMPPISMLLTIEPSTPRAIPSTLRATISTTSHILLNILRASRLSPFPMLIVRDPAPRINYADCSVDVREVTPVVEYETRVNTEYVSSVSPVYSTETRVVPSTHYVEQTHQEGKALDRVFERLLTIRPSLVRDSDCCRSQL